MNYRILILLVLLLSIASTVSAAYTNQNFTPIFNKTDIVHVNQSYIIYDQNAIPLVEWIIELTMGLLFFILSCIYSARADGREVDALFSVMSMFPMFVAAFTATSIDVVTGYGVTANALSPAVYTLIENHTIYHFDITGIVLWIFSMISTLNTIRIVVNHKKFDAMFKDKGEK
jgi:hypothetical protein